MIKKLMKEMMKEDGKGKKMSDVSKEAKMNVLKHMSDKAGSDMGDTLSKKIVIKADSKEGLKKGLEVAEDKLEEDSDEVSMDKDEFMEEHEELIDTLRSGSKEDNLEEADEQEEEMEEVEEEAYEDYDDIEDVESEIEELEKKLEELKSSR